MIYIMFPGTLPVRLEWTGSLIALNMDVRRARPQFDHSRTDLMHRPWFAVAWAVHGGTSTSQHH